MKPSNIVIDEGGLAKLCDFGLARRPSASMTIGGGTPMFMPPEQLVSGDGGAAGDAAGAALIGGAPARGAYNGMSWDVYSLAVTLVAMWAPGEFYFIHTEFSEHCVRILLTF